MLPITKTCVPRPEVLEGELRDDIFAARLRDVVEGSAPEIYGDAATFFRNTYPTQGLRDLLAEVLGRVTGKKPSSSPIIRLETAFGGGKTHNLIALHHIAKGRASGAMVDGLLDASLLPDSPIKHVAGLVGSDLEPASGFLHDDTGIRTYTIGGEIAHQIGGAEAYEVVKAADEGRNAIGTNVLGQIIGDEPCLIMLDEMGRYLRDAASVPTPGNKRKNLAETTVATFMSLLEFASSRESCVVVLTLADSTDAFGKENDEIRVELAEAKKVSARQERVLSPSGEVEMPRIVTHRLFETVDRNAADATAKAYAAFYEKVQDQDAEFSPPQSVLRTEYADEIARDYPFHPTLLRTLRRKTSTIPSFQQTRGALRLLARAVRDLWNGDRQASALFHIHDLDFNDDDVVNDLTSRLERPAFRSVIEADICSAQKGTRSHAQDLDEVRVQDGKSPYASRLATAIFLNSLTQGVASGMDRSELAESVLVPHDDPAYLRKVLHELEDRCWFLDFDGDRLRFRTEASINKMIADEASAIATTRAKKELEDRIRKVWKKGVFHPLYFRSEAGEVDDDAKEPKLVIVHFDAANAAEGDEHQAAPEFVLQIFEHSGSMEGYRSFKNNVLFLVSDGDHVDSMVSQVRRQLAISRILGDQGRMKDFTGDQRKRLRQHHDSSELDVRVSITRAYRFLYYPSEDAPKACRGLRRHTLPAQDQGEVKVDQSQIVLRVLKKLGKVLTDDDAAKAPEWLRAKAWPVNATHVSTEGVRKEFARRIGLPILLDLNQLKKTIKLGIEHGQWVYYVAEEELGYGQNSPAAPLVVFSEDVELWDEAEARTRGMKLKGEEKTEPEPCLVCGNDPCTCADDIEDDDHTKPKADLRGTGAPAQAFQQLRDLCGEQGVTSLSCLDIRLEGDGKQGAKELRSIGLAIPQLGKATFEIEQDLTVEFAGREHLIVKFIGPWDRYKRLKQVTDAMVAEGSKQRARTRIVATFEAGLAVAGPQFETIHEVLAGLEFGRLVVVASPEKAPA